MTRLEWEKASRKGREAAARRKHWDERRQSVALSERGLKGATSKQINVIRRLSKQLDRPYVHPENRAAASVAISRLLQLAAAKQGPTT